MKDEAHDAPIGAAGEADEIVNTLSTPVEALLRQRTEREKVIDACARQGAASSFALDAFLVHSARDEPVINRSG
jgi:hypothetical protein